MRGLDHRELFKIEEKGRELATYYQRAPLNDLENWLKNLTTASEQIRADLMLVFRDTDLDILLAEAKYYGYDSVPKEALPRLREAERFHNAIELADKLAQAGTNFLAACEYAGVPKYYPIARAYQKLTSTSWFLSGLDSMTTASAICSTLTGKTCTYFDSNGWLSSPGKWLNDLTALYHRLIEFYTQTFGENPCPRVHATASAPREAVDLACVWSRTVEKLNAIGAYTPGDYDPLGAYVSPDRIDFRVGSADQHTSKLMLRSRRLYYVDDDLFVVVILSLLLKKKGAVFSHYDNSEAEFDLAHADLRGVVKALATATSMDVRCSPIVNALPYRVYERAMVEGASSAIVHDEVHRYLSYLMSRRPQIGEYKATAVMAQYVANCPYLPKFEEHLTFLLRKYPPTKGRSNLHRYMEEASQYAFHLCANAHELMLKNLVGW